MRAMKRPNRSPAHAAAEQSRYVQKNNLMADGVGFEPTVRFPARWFQDQFLKPLGHPSSFAKALPYKQDAVRLSSHPLAV